MNRRIAILFALAGFSLMACWCGGAAPKDGAGGPDQKTNDQRPDKVLSEDEGGFKVEIENDKLSINGVVIPSRADIAEVEKALGKSSGSSGTGVWNAIFWKDQGVRCLQEKGTMKIRNISFHFKGYYDSETITYSKPFKGSFVINGEKMTKATKMPELGRKLNLKRDDFTWSLIFEDEALNRTIIFIKAPLDTPTDVDVGR